MSINISDGTMSQRERFLRWMTFQPVDRIPFMEFGFWDETFERWHHEGLPKWVRQDRHIEAYLGMDISFNRNWLPINDDLYPAFKVEILEETQNEVVLREATGIVCRRRKRFQTIPQYIRFPVQNEQDYEDLLPRLDGSAPGRYPADSDEDLHWRRERGEIVGVHLRSLFGYPRQLMGMEGWCMAFYDQPDLVRRIIADRVAFAKQVLARVLATGALDFVQVWEDMAFKTAPLIGPELVREFMLPGYQELVAYLRQGGVKLIMVDCDGWVGSLLPIWLEAGIDGVHPCEIAANSEPVALRREFPGVRMMGGIDKRAIASGKEGTDAELARVRPLLQEGGYIPLFDHFVPPDVAYADYLYYYRQLRELVNQA